MVEVVEKVDIPVNAVATRSLDDHLIPVLWHAIHFPAIGPETNLDQILPQISQGQMSDELRNCGRNVHEDSLRTIRENGRFVNRVCDAGTVPSNITQVLRESSSDRLCSVQFYFCPIAPLSGHTAGQVMCKNEFAAPIEKSLISTPHRGGNKE
jgi:hypothetical protein